MGLDLRHPRGRHKFIRNRRQARRFRILQKQIAQVPPSQHNIRLGPLPRPIQLYRCLRADRNEFCYQCCWFIVNDAVFHIFRCLQQCYCCCSCKNHTHAFENNCDVTAGNFPMCKFHNHTITMNQRARSFCRCDAFRKGWMSVAIYNRGSISCPSFCRDEGGRCGTLGQRPGRT